MAAKTPDLTVEPKILAAVHAALKSIRDPRNTIPICGMLLLEADGNGVTVTATDCDVEAAVTFEAKAGFSPIALPPFLIEAASGAAGSEVNFRFDEHNAVVTAGRARFSVPTLPGSDFPKFQPGYSSRAEIAGCDLARVVASVVGAADASGGPRYYLEGVFLQCVDARLHAVATDGHRLHTRSIEAPKGMVSFEGIIVPTKAAREIIRLGQNAGDHQVIVETSERAIAVTANNERIVSKLIDGTYPDWRRVVPNPSGIRATVDLVEILAVLDRVMKIQAINESDMKAKSKAGAIKLHEDGEFLVITTGRGDVEASDAVRAEFAGAFGARGVSAKYLRATLVGMKEHGSETVTIDSPDAGSPMLIESPTDEDFLGVVMPMRI
jgi:DNA polymerase-3 subunit beta